MRMLHGESPHKSPKYNFERLSVSSSIRVREKYVCSPYITNIEKINKFLLGI